jgi:hypothetical protein
MTMEKRASIYGLYMKIYRINSHRELTRGDPPAWGLDVRPTSLCCKMFSIKKILQWPLEIFFGMIKVMFQGCKNLYLEC